MAINSIESQNKVHVRRSVGGLRGRKLLYLAGLMSAFSLPLGACENQEVYSTVGSGFKELNNPGEYQPVDVYPEFYAMLPAPYQTVLFKAPTSTIAISHGTEDSDERIWDKKEKEWIAIATPSPVHIIDQSDVIADVHAAINVLNRGINARLGLPSSYVDYYGAQWFTFLESNNPVKPLLTALEKDGHDTSTALRHYGETVYYKTNDPIPETVDSPIVYAARFNPEMTVVDGNYTTHIRYSPSADTTKTGLTLTFYKGVADIGQIHVVYPFSLGDLVKSVQNDTSPTDTSTVTELVDHPLPIDQICNFRVPLSEMPPSMLDAANSTLAQAIEDFRTLYPSYEPEFVVELREYSLETGKEIISSRTITYSELTQSDMTTSHSGHGMGINLGLVYDLALQGTSETTGSSVTSGSVHDSGQTTDSSSVVHTSLDIQGYVRLVPVTSP